MITWGQDLGEPECPYAKRWIIDLGIISIRVHHWLRSDDKRAPHDHPAWFATCVLKGSYEDWSYEPTASGSPRLENAIIDRLEPGSIRFRRANHIHSVSVGPDGCWTFLIFGREKRTWGFWTKRKDGAVRFIRSKRYFHKHGHHPCDQP